MEGKFMLGFYWKTFLDMLSIKEMEHMDKDRILKSENDNHVLNRVGGVDEEVI